VTHLPLFSQVEALFFSVSGSKSVLFEIQSDGKKKDGMRLQAAMQQYDRCQNRV
jgi:hypothetical protein